MDTVTTIQIANFANIYAQGLSEEVLLLDVRTPAEFNEEHLNGAINIPLHELSETLDRLRGHNLIYIYCRTGSRSHTASQYLAEAGINGVINLGGGLVAWKELNHDTHLNTQVGISIDRQVKLIAGTGVVISILLASLIHPALIGLALFIGSGLTFAGASGICALAILLARMPWNRHKVQQTNPQLRSTGRTL